VKCFEPANRRMVFATVTRSDSFRKDNFLKVDKLLALGKFCTWALDSYRLFKVLNVNTEYFSSLSNKQFENV
jgi:hypothetical protein